MRRKAKNETGILRKKIAHNANDAWVAFICVNCGKLNLVHIGDHLITPKDAFENDRWECSECGYIHSKDSDLPESWDNWSEDLLIGGQLSVERFWKAFFTSCTENKDAFWKQCNVCGRILPSSYFSHHKGWGPLEKQMECKACKAAINAKLNCKRTSEQLREASARRRIAELLMSKSNQIKRLDYDKIFDKFGGVCFKSGKKLNKEDTSSWAIDHILPQKYLWPLTENNACLLSTECNADKRDKWPSEYYDNNELIRLAKITGADLNLLMSPTPIINKDVDVNGGVDRYLTIRNNNHDMPKRIQVLKKVLESYGLVDQLDAKHKSILGYSTTTKPDTHDQ